MKISKFKDFDWDHYRTIVDGSVSKKYFLDYELPENNTSKIDAFYISKKYKILYIPISKNASTSFKASLDFFPYYIKPKSNTFFDLYIPEKYKLEYKIVALTRDPYSRWVSGLNEFISSFDISFSDKESMYPILNELKNKKFIFDGHTLPQFSFLDYCFQPSKIDFNINLYKIDDDNLDEKISSLIGQKIKLKKQNCFDQDALKIKNYFFCKKILDQYCLNNSTFLELYKQDLMIYNNSK